jgi:hypothetical protein
MFLQVVEDITTGVIEISMDGTITTPNAMNISLPNVNDTSESGVDMYVSGF